MSKNGKKTCKKCRETKPVERFEGGRNECKDCRNARYRVANMTAEQVEKKNARRQKRRKDPEYRKRENAAERERMEDPGYRERRQAAQRERKRERRANMTPEQREQERARDRERRANMTPEQREKIYARRRVANMTPEQREKKNADARRRVANMTPEQKARRTRAGRKWKANRTEEQREEIREKGREYMRKKRANMSPEQKAEQQAKSNAAARERWKTDHEYRKRKSDAARARNAGDGFSTYIVVLDHKERGIAAYHGFTSRKLVSRMQTHHVLKYFYREGWDVRFQATSLDGCLFFKECQKMKQACSCEMRARDKERANIESGFKVWGSRLLNKKTPAELADMASGRDCPRTFRDWLQK